MRAASIIPVKDPIWIIIDATPDQMVSFPASALPESPWASNVFFSTLRWRSIAKKPIPQRPITPAQASSIPTIAWRRHRRSAKSDR